MTEAPSRVLLWIDGAGGFVVVGGKTVTIGAGTDWTAKGPDLPLAGPLSSRQAELRRDSEGWLLRPLKPLRLNGHDLSAEAADPGRAAALRSGDRCEWPGKVTAEFVQPHPWSLSARLDFGNTRRLPRGIGAALLWADALLLGAGSGSHASLGPGNGRLTLVRDGDGTVYRSDRPFRIGDGPAVTEGFGTFDQPVAGEDWSLRWSRLPCPVPTAIG